MSLDLENKASVVTGEGDGIAPFPSRDKDSSLRY